MCAGGAAACVPPTKPSGIESGFPPFPLHVFYIIQRIANRREITAHTCRLEHALNGDIGRDEIRYAPAETSGSVSKRCWHESQAESCFQLQPWVIQRPVFEIVLFFMGYQQCYEIYTHVMGLFLLSEFQVGLYSRLQQLKNKMTRKSTAVTLPVAVRLKWNKNGVSGNQPENAATAHSATHDRLPNCWSVSSCFFFFPSLSLLLLYLRVSRQRGSKHPHSTFQHPTAQPSPPFLPNEVIGNR